MSGRKKGLLLLALCAALLGLTGCVQQYALIPIATVRGRILSNPTGLNKVGIRVNVVGSSTEANPATSDFAFCDVEGDFAVETSRLGRGWVVARGLEYDIGHAPIYFKDYGETQSISRWIPSTSTAELFQKTSGKSRFLVFEDDWGQFSSVHLVGDFCDWKLAGAKALHDDGSLLDVDASASGTQTSGDDAAGDGVWTLYTDVLSSGDQKYGFVFDMDDGTVKRDPYEEDSSSGRSVIRVK